MNLQPFGSGESIIKYLGRYVCRTAISDLRVISISDSHLSFRWKDRANGDAPKVETLEGVEFVRRYLRHVLPSGMRSIRYYGFCHSAAKVKRERIAFHTGRPLQLGALALPPPKPAPAPYNCPCCEGEVSAQQSTSRIFASDLAAMASMQRDSRWSDWPPGGF